LHLPIRYSGIAKLVLRKSTAGKIIPHQSAIPIEAVAYGDAIEKEFALALGIGRSSLLESILWMQLFYFEDFAGEVQG
jgi:hypothetical protein